VEEEQQARIEQSLVSVLAETPISRPRHILAPETNWLISISIVGFSSASDVVTEGIPTVSLPGSTTTAK
jgi:hypothetical protein